MSLLQVFWAEEDLGMYSENFHNYASAACDWPLPWQFSRYHANYLHEFQVPEYQSVIKHPYVTKVF